MLDTNTCVGVLRQRPGMVQRLSELAPTDCAVSMVTVYELFGGVEKANDPAKERQKVERFVSAIIEPPFDRAGAEAAAKIRGELERQGTLIGPYDLLTAGQAFASGLALVTNKFSEFQRVSGLKLESGRDHNRRHTRGEAVPIDVECGGAGRTASAGQS